MFVSTACDVSNAVRLEWYNAAEVLSVGRAGLWTGRLEDVSSVKGERAPRLLADSNRQQPCRFNVRPRLPFTLTQLAKPLCFLLQALAPS